MVGFEAMKLGYTIVYVDDVPATLARFEAAFGLERRLLTEDNGYAELATGATVLSLAEREFGRSHFTDPDIRAMFDGAHRMFELGMVTPDVPAGYARALESGLAAVVPPTVKPWGQTVAWVRDPSGILVEIASPME